MTEPLHRSSSWLSRDCASGYPEECDDTDCDGRRPLPLTAERRAFIAEDHEYTRYLDGLGDAA